MDILLFLQSVNLNQPKRREVQSSEIRNRVERARDRQFERYQTHVSNAKVPTYPDSSGYLNISRVFFWNSAISSRKRTPRCASEISPGLKELPPPIMETDDAE